MLRYLFVFVFVLLGNSIAAGQQRAVCNETSKNTPIVVRAGERIILETRSFPDGYPNVSCGFNLHPANANISFNIVFEYFLLNPTDALTFANSEGAVLESLSGNDWINRRDFVFSTANRSDVSGNISLNLTVRDNVRSGGFRAWVIGYDRITSSNNSNCGNNITLDEGESFIYLSPSASGTQNVNSSDGCRTTVTQANKYIRFRAVVNYVHMINDENIDIFEGPREIDWLSRWTESNFPSITRITEEAKEPIGFRLHQQGNITNQSVYFIVVQAFFKDEPCPDSGRTFDLVNDGPNNFEGNLMKPFIITTSDDDFASDYANDLQCQWTVTVPDTTKYVIAVWFKVFETEECCDKLDIGNTHTFPQPSFSGALINKNGVPWQNETAPLVLFTTNRLFLTFTSDSIRTGLGMRLEVRSLPKTSSEASDTPVIISVPNNITTPGYPYAYEDNQNVEWRFVGENGSALFFQIINENANDILLDEARHTSITFYDGPFITDPILKRFDKFSRNETEEFNRGFWTTQQYLTVRFTTREYRLAEDPENANDIGIFFIVRPISVDEIDNLTTTTAISNETTTTPATNTSSPNTTTTTLPDANTTTTTLPDTNTTTTTLPDANTTTTTTIATTTKQDPSGRGSAHSLLPDHRALIMTMILMISSIALYCC